MRQATIPPPTHTQKNRIAFIAQDNCKHELIDWARKHYDAENSTTFAPLAQQVYGLNSKSACP